MLLDKELKDAMKGAYMSAHWAWSTENCSITEKKKQIEMIREVLDVAG